MPRIILNMTLIMLIMAVSVSAQDRPGIVRISSFSGSGIPASELATLERLVASHVAELRLFRVTDDAGREMALGETEIALSLGNQSSLLTPLAADFILSGHLGRIGDLYVFTLENTRVSTGEKISVSDTSISINDVVLRARSLTRSLFGKADDVSTVQADSFPLSGNPGGARLASAITSGTNASANPAMPALPGIDVAPTPSLTQVAGTWRGDRGLETIRLFPNGTGIAVLSGGGTMRLRIALDADLVVIVQDQANDAAMYRSPNFGFEIAKRVASLARPMKWLFHLSADNQLLKGVKESIQVSGTSSAITVHNDYVREASWTRISR